METISKGSDFSYKKDFYKDPINQALLLDLCQKTKALCSQINGRDFAYKVFEQLQKKIQQDTLGLNLDIYAAAQKGYAKYILGTYRDTPIPFCFTLIVLAPGQFTPKHSHRVDCGPVCLKGQIQEIRYKEEQQLDKIALVETGKYNYQKGDGGYLLQDEPNTHALYNNSSAIAMSLHLYLFDPEACTPEKCTSIEMIYD